MTRTTITIIAQLTLLTLCAPPLAEAEPAWGPECKNMIAEVKRLCTSYPHAPGIEPACEGYKKGIESLTNVASKAPPERIEQSCTSVLTSMQQVESAWNQAGITARPVGDAAAPVAGATPTALAPETAPPATDTGLLPHGGLVPGGAVVGFTIGQDMASVRAAIAENGWVIAEEEDVDLHLLTEGMDIPQGKAVYQSIILAGTSPVRKVRLYVLDDALIRVKVFMEKGVDIAPLTEGIKGLEDKGAWAYARVGKIKYDFGKAAHKFYVCDPDLIQLKLMPHL